MNKKILIIHNYYKDYLNLFAKIEETGQFEIVTQNLEEFCSLDNDWIYISLTRPRHE